MRRLSLLCIAILLPGAALAERLPVPDHRPPVPRDSIRAEAFRARQERDWGRAADLQRRMLAADGADGFALRELATTAWERDEVEPLLDALAVARPRVLGGVELSPTAAAYVRGVGEYLRGRLRSSRRHLEEAVRSAPDWGWPHTTLVRVLTCLDAPRDQIRAHALVAYADPDALPAALVGRLRYRDIAPLDPPPENRGDALAFLRTVPWTALDAEDLAIWAGEDRAPRPREAWEARWGELRRRHGAAAGYLAAAMAARVTRDLSPSEALGFLAARGREADGAPAWRAEEVRFLAMAGRFARAESVACTLPTRGADFFDALLSVGADSRSRATLLGWADSLARTSLWPGQALPVRSTYETLGDETRRRGFDSLLAAEAPELLLSERLDRLVADDLDAAGALLDSLRAADAFLGLLGRFEFELREARGDTIPRAALDSLPAGLREWVTVGIADRAAASGRYERALRLWEYAGRVTRPHIGVLLAPLSTLLARGQRAAALRQCERLVAEAEGCPGVEYQVLAALVSLGEREAALRRLDHLTVSAADEPYWLGQAAFAALHLGRDAQADSLLAAAKRGAPDSRMVRYVEARMLAERGQRDRALVVAEGLLRDRPGDARFRSLRATLREPGEQDEPAPHRPVAERFGALGDDLSGTDWMLPLSAAADTVSNLSAVYLLQRDQVACDQLESVVSRRHTTIKLLSREALETLRTMRLSFLVSEGPPIVREARVVQPDGRVVKLDRRDFKVTSSTDSDVDVGEERHLVLPMPDLRVGSIIDIEFDEVTRSDVGDGWVIRTFLPPEYRTLRRVLEIRTRQGLPVTFKLGAGAPAPVVRTTGAYLTRVWDLADPPPIEVEDSAGSPFESHPWVGVTSHVSWEAAVESFRADFWKRVTLDRELRDLAARLTRDAPTPEARLDSLLGYVVRHVNYVAIELGRGRVMPSPASEVLRRGYGDCKDMAVLLIALAEAAGMAAQPVLVSFDGLRPPTDDFVDPGSFTHMIVLLPGPDGGRWCDPTVGVPCAVDLPMSVAGLRGLTFSRSERARLVQIPPARAAAQGMNMSIDVRPAERNTATIDVRARYRGELARGIEAAIAQSDTAWVRAAVERVVGYGLWTSCRQERWTVEDRGCGSITLAAAYRDTAWGSGGNTVKFSLRTEVADPVTSYPPAEGRRTDVVCDYPFSDTVVVRLHDGAGWEAVPEVAALPVRGPTYEGTLESKQSQEGDGRCLQITQRFELRERRMTPEAYRAFRQDWLAFLSCVYQPYRYRRALDSLQIVRLEDYAREHPEDSGFMLQSVLRIVGSDMGGEGPAGQSRRAAARRLLTAAARDPEQGAAPLALLGTLEFREGRLRLADSLLTAARRLEPRNMFLLGVHLGVKAWRDDHPATLALLRESQQRGGSAEIQLQLVTMLHQLGRKTEADEAERRYYLIADEPDSAAVDAARFQGALRAFDCEWARRELLSLQGRVPADSYRRMEASLCTACGPLRRAMRLLEDLWLEDPLDPTVCNNLAWMYARLGERLDRAEELAHASCILSQSETSSRNTLGAIHARAGRWEEAAAIFRSIVGESERPSDHEVNSYFLGLYEHQRGQRREALERWRKLLPTVHEPEWRSIVGRSIALAEQGRPPTEAIFTTEPE